MLLDFSVRLPSVAWNAGDVAVGPVPCGQAVWMP
jgi:hypothetical protein